MTAALGTVRFRRSARCRARGADVAGPSSPSGSAAPGGTSADLGGVVESGIGVSRRRFRTETGRSRACPRQLGRVRPSRFEAVGAVHRARLGPGRIVVFDQDRSSGSGAGGRSMWKLAKNRFAGRDRAEPWSDVARAPRPWPVRAKHISSQEYVSTITPLRVNTAGPASARVPDAGHTGVRCRRADFLRASCPRRG